MFFTLLNDKMKIKFEIIGIHNKDDILVLTIHNELVFTYVDINVWLS